MLLCVFVFLCSPLATAQDRVVRMPVRHRSFFTNYCVQCHDAETQEGKTRLDDIPFAIADIPTAERWQKVLGVLNAGEMPPPARANVPQLSRHAGKLLSARELLTAHMEEPQCYQCHRKIDPIGFGLEHFDAVGKWRETESTEIAVNNRVRNSKEHPIDATGQLPDGMKFNDFFELRDAVADREEAFARGLIEHLIEYALGRPFGFSDEELAESILETSKQQKLTMRSIIHAIVQSHEFQTKR